MTDDLHTARTVSLINRARLLVDHAQRSLAMADPDRTIVAKLLADALHLVALVDEPPDPYADTRLRPGLTVGEAAAAGMIAPPEGGRDV